MELSIEISCSEINIDRFLIRKRILRPEQGSVIRGCAGLRKLRWGAKGRGKRDGLRVIYFWDKEFKKIYMLFIYPKNAQEDLTPAQLRMLGSLVREELR